MNPDTTSEVGLTVADIIQIAAVLTAIAASIVALVIAHFDRRTQLRIARRGIEQQRLLVELEYAVRLSANRNRGGSSNSEERDKLGAEALALAVVVGERWVPRQWERASDSKSPEQMREQLEAPETVDNPQWVKDKIESGLAVQAILQKLYTE